jgi:hypothetical protein
VKTQYAFFLGCCFLSLFGCAQATVEESVRPPGSGGGQNGEGGGGTPNPIALPDSGLFIPPWKSTGDARPLRCDSTGSNCVCMNILSLGKTATYGAGTGDSTDAFIQYMNTKSSAKVDLQTSFVSLSESYLGNYDVIILQDLEDGIKGAGPFWDTRFTKSDIDNLEKWVRNGGAIISMTGYGGNPQEVLPTNQLLKFTGISYNTDDIFDQCADNFCYCTDSSIPYSGWNPAETDFSTNMKAVGVFHGRSINCSDCTKVAEFGSKKIAVAKTIGKGRVFAFADEWVTYTSQWGVVPTMFESQTNCIGHTAKDLYSVPQFWYNVIRWGVPNAACFQIDDAIIF